MNDLIPYEYVGRIFKAREFENWCKPSHLKSFAPTIQKNNVYADIDPSIFYSQLWTAALCSSNEYTRTFENCCSPMYL
jgi:hypothetical protein